MPGPGGTSAVEAALKLARNATWRYTVGFFTGGLYRMALGSLVVTADPAKHARSRRC